MQPKDDDWTRFINADHDVDGVERVSYVDPMDDEVRFQKTEQVNKAIAHFWEVYCSGRFEKVINHDSLCSFLREMIEWLLTLTNERRVIQRRQLEHIISRFEQYSQSKNQSTLEGSGAAMALFDWYVQKKPNHRDLLADALLNAGRKDLSGRIHRTEIRQTWMQKLTGGATHFITNASHVAGQLLLTSDSHDGHKPSTWAPRFPGDIELIGQIAPLIDSLVSAQFSITDDQAADVGQLYRALEVLVHQRKQIALMSEPKQIEAAIRLLQEPQRFSDPVATMFVNLVYRQNSQTQQLLSVGVAKIAQHNEQLFQKIADEISSWTSASQAAPTGNIGITPKATTKSATNIRPEKQLGLQQLEKVCESLLPLDRIAHICRGDLRGFVRDAVNGRALMNLLMCGKIEPSQADLDDGYRKLQRLTHPDTGANSETQEIGRCVSTLRELTGTDFNLANAVSVVQALQQASLNMARASSVTIVIRPARQIVVAGSVKLDALLATQNITATRILINGKLIDDQQAKEISVKAGDLVEVIVPTAE